MRGKPDGYASARDALSARLAVTRTIARSENERARPYRLVRGAVARRDMIGAMADTATSTRSDQAAPIRSAKLSGKVFIIFMICVWIAVIAGVTFMVISFKRGGVDALRVDKKPAATSTDSK